MRKQMKQTIAFVLAFSMLLNSLLMANVKYANAEEDIVEETTMQEEVDMADEYDVKISYNVTSSWDGHCNVDVTLSNILDEKIDNWEITISANFKVENIWNAKVTSQEEDEYTIHNAEWNQDIPLDGSVTFGMTVACDEDVVLPEYCLVNRESVPVEDCKIEYVEYSNWDNQVNGKIVITNTGKNKIEDWSLDFESNFIITSIWNGEIMYSEEDNSPYYYEIENVVNNQNIEVGQSVEFGFIATCEEKAEIYSKEAFEMGVYEEDDTEYVIEGPYDYEDDECIYDADYFETREEYEEYIANLTPTTWSRKEQSSPTSTPKPTPTPKVIPCALDMKFDLAASDKAIQNYLPVPGGVYTMHHRVNDKKKVGVNDALLRSAKESQNKYISFSEPIILTGFAHGQTFEQFYVGNQEYYFLAGNAHNGFARELVIMKKEKFNQIAQSKGYDYATGARNKRDFLRLGDLEYANKRGKKSSRMNRVDAALTADGKTLVIWKRLINGTTEISLYNMKKLRRCFSEGIKGTFSFKGKNKKNAKKIRNSCYGSFYERRGNTYILHPNGSFQSIDIEKVSKGKWDVYITSGQEKHTKPVTITKIRFAIAGRLTYKVYREYIAFPGIAQTDLKFELEGGHIVGDDLKFAVVKYRTEDDKEQYLAKVSLDKINTPYKK